MLSSELHFFLIHIWKQTPECLERNYHVERQLNELFKSKCQSFLISQLLRSLLHDSSKLRTKQRNSDFEVQEFMELHL